MNFIIKAVIWKTGAYLKAKNAVYVRNWLNKF